MPKINKVVRIALSGGIIGALTTNPRRALDSAIEEHNQQGWNCHQILQHSTSNIFIKALQVLVLISTLCLWTFGAGYILLMEKERP